MRFLVVTFFWGIVSFANAQEVTPQRKQNRFIPFGIDKEINSIYNELNPVFSLDEKTIYFSRVNHPDNHYGDFYSQDIWFSELDKNDTWSQPKRVEATFNNSRFNSIYSITQQGDFLVSGTYTKKGRYKGRGLSFTTQTKNGWSIPQKIKIPKITKQDKGVTSSMFMNKEATFLILLYSSSWAKISDSKIRYSNKKSNGKWSKPKKIKNKEVAKSFSSIESPYLSDDNLSLYFSAYKKGKTTHDKNNIYVISRKDVNSNAWGNPVKLSDTVNSDEWENYYKRFGQNNWAVFSRASMGADADIYIVKLVEPKPYVDIKGVVKLNDEPFIGDFKIKINGQIVDSVRINKDSSSYAIHLPLGNRYELEADVVEMQAKVEVIDARNDLEYLPIERNLEISLLPFLDLSGVVTVNGDLLTEPFTVLVDGNNVDSLTTNYLDGSYSVKLPLGKAYRLEVVSGNYITEIDSVDVTADSFQVRIEKNLHLSAIPYVDIAGNLFNAEDSTALLQQTNPKLVINGIVVDSISTLGSTYKIRLKWGEKYTFQVQADEFASVVAVIDLITVKNYQKIEQDLFANSLKKYATITGSVINMKTNSPIKSDFIIEVDGARNTNAIINKGLGSYRIKIALGERNTLTANAKSYFPISNIVDLTGKSENIALKRDLQMMPLIVGEKILLNNVFFESASTKLRPDSYSDINRVVDLLRAVPSLKIEISGHTDNIGKDAYNQGISDSRAKSVVDYILAQNINKDRITHKGYGEGSPVATNLTSFGRSKNRRVEFIVLEIN